VLSFTYLAMAVACIVYGFRRRFSYIRLYGLGLTFIALESSSSGTCGSSAPGKDPGVLRLRREPPHNLIHISEN